MIVLGKREIEVAALVAEGLSTKQIALRLKLSPRTVEAHRTHICEKLGLAGYGALKRWAEGHFNESNEVAGIQVPA